MLGARQHAAREQLCAGKSALPTTQIAWRAPGPRPVERLARTRCQASAAAAGALELLAPSLASTALATYQLPRPAQPFSSSTRAWFEAMVQTIVRQLDGSTPFLLKVALNPMLQLNVERLAPGELLGWPALQQQHFSSGQAWDAVVLVHPVSSKQQPCAVSQAQGEPCSGCPHTAPAGSPHYSSPDTELLHGTFGDCCGGSEAAAPGASQPTPAAAAAASAEGGGTATPHDSHHQHQHQHHHHHQQQEQAARSSQVAYYGVVVQCRDGSDPLQGCYLLKTMQVSQHSGGGSGCHCTHYSLNRVCLGPSLQQQFQAAWLV